jgi:hypothetical protein
VILDDIPTLEPDDPRIELAIAEGEMENYEVREIIGIQKLHLDVSFATSFTRSKKHNFLCLSTSRSGSKASHIINLGSVLKTSRHLHVSVTLCLIPTGLVL